MFTYLIRYYQSTSQALAFVDLKEHPHPCHPANLSRLSDYVLGALACGDMELNCAGGTW